MNTRSTAFLLFALFALGSLQGCFYVVEPGWRGVRVTLGKMDEAVITPGFGFKAPIVTEIRQVNVQQATEELTAECFSADLQQLKVRIKVLYRIPEASAIAVLRDFSGDPFDSLIVPRVQEAI